MKLSKLSILVGLLFALHSAYTVAKSNNNINKVRNHLYDEHNSIDFNNFPAEVRNYTKIDTNRNNTKLHTGLNGFINRVREV
jgi:hypothetical protein